MVLANLGRDRLARDGHAACEPTGSWAWPPIDWSGEELAKKGQEQGRGQGGEVEERDRPPARNRRPPTRSRNTPANTSTLVMASSRSSSSDGKLNFAYNSIEAPLEHWHFEVFRALKNPKDPAFEDQKVQFLTNVKGYVDGIAVPFEPSLKPIVFAMRPDARLSDPDYLKRFTGEYELAGQDAERAFEGKRPGARLARAGSAEPRPGPG